MAVKIWTGTVSTDPTVAGNWDPSGQPADGDSIIVPATAGVAMAGADLTTAGTVHFVGFTIEEGFGFAVGSADTYLQIDLENPAVAWFDANIAAIVQVYLDIDNYGVINVTRSPAGPTGEFGVNLIGLHDDGTAGRGVINVNLSSSTGTVGIGANADQDMEVNQINVIGGTATVGAAVTEFDDAGAPDVEVTGGTLTTKCNLTTATVYAGTWNHTEDATVTTANVWGGTCNYFSTGTAATFNIGGIVDLSNNLANRTFTTTILYRGGSLIDPYKATTFTNGIDITGVDLAGVTLNLGTHLTVQRTAI